MPAKSRLFFAASVCLMLSSCGLIGTALRLAPYAMLFADGNGKSTLEKRGQEVQEKGGRRAFPAAATDTGAHMAYHR